MKHSTFFDTVETTNIYPYKYRNDNFWHGPLASTHSALSALSHPISLIGSFFISI